MHISAKVQRRWLMISVGLAASLVAAACSSSSSSPPASGSTPAASTAPSAKATGNPIPVGLSADLSGAFSSLGVPYIAGAQTYFDWLNNHGGVDGRPVDAIKLDTQGQPTVAVSDAKQLASDKVLAVVGDVASTTQIPMQTVFDQANIPVIVFTPTDQLLPDKDFFSVGISATADYAIEAKFCKSLMQSKGVSPVKVAFFHIDTPAQTANVAVTTTLAKSWGWHVTGNYLYSATSPDVAPEVLQMSRQSPSCIVGAVLDNEMPATMNAMQQYGISAPFVNFFAGNDEATFRTLHSPQFYAVRDFADATDTAPAGAAAMHAAAQQYGTYSTMESGGNLFTKGWLAGKVIALALQKCGSGCTSAKMDTTMENLGPVDTEGFGPDILFSPTDRVGVKTAKIYQWSSSQNRSVAVTGELSAPVPTGG